jgi:hypothetical protein
MQYTELDARDIAAQVKMDYYPFEYLSPLATVAGSATLSARPGCEPGAPIQISPTLGEIGFILTYLHEACHLIARRFNLDQVGPHNLPHNHYFGALVAICYQRIGQERPRETVQLWRLSLYDFSDMPGYLSGKQETDEGHLPSAAEWIERFSFMMRACEHYAGTGLTIEAIAADLAKWRKQTAIATANAARGRETARAIRRWAAIAGLSMLGLGVGVVSRLNGWI